MFIKKSLLPVWAKVSHFIGLSTLLSLVLTSLSFPSSGIRINEGYTTVNNPPVFSSENVVVFYENGTGTVLDVNANDGDEGADDLSVNYELGGVDATYFSINANGILTFNNPPDFYSPIDSDSDNVYQLTITADNGAVENNIALQEVKIVVLPTVNDDFSSNEELNNFLGNESGDWFGSAVVTNASGNIMAMGAVLADVSFTHQAGFTRVVEWTNDGWKQKGSLIFGEQTIDRSSQSLDMDFSGNVLAIGSLSYSSESIARTGAVRVYFWNGTEWAQRGQILEGTSEDAQFGYSVSLSADGSVLAVGANYHDDQGSEKTGQVKVYRWSGDSWVQMGQTFEGVENDAMGQSVNLDSQGRTLAIGAANFGNTNNGYVRVYKWNGEQWGKLGTDIEGDDTDDLLGFSLSLNGDGKTLVVGAPYSDNPVRRTGYVRAYTWDGSKWNLKGGTIQAGDFTAGLFGYSVEISADGDVIAISAEEYGESDQGRVLMYKWTGSAWTRVFDHIGNESDRSFGYDVGLSADARILAVGVPFSDKNGNDAGEVRSFILDNNTPADFELSETFFLEAQPMGTVVGTFNIVGAGAGVKASYSFEPGEGDTDNPGFSIVDGVLTTMTEFDFETSNSLTIRVKVTTESGGSLEKQFSLSVENINEAPVFISNPVVLAPIDELYEYRPKATDPENDLVVFSAASLPDWLSLKTLPGGEKDMIHISTSLIRDFAEDSEGNIYFTFAGEQDHRVMKLNQDREASVFAGSEGSGYRDGTGTDASFNSPEALVTDAEGNVYVSDNGNIRIRKITKNGVVSTFVGSGVLGNLNGIGTEAQLHGISDMVIDDSGNLFIAEPFAGTIRKISSTGEVSSFVGSGSFGLEEGTGTEAVVSNVSGLTLVKNNTIYGVTSSSIFKVSPDAVMQIIWEKQIHSTTGFVDGELSVVNFASLSDIAVHSDGSLYLIDAGNDKIRRIDPDNMVTTLTDIGGFNLDFTSEGILLATDLDNSINTITTPSQMLTGTNTLDQSYPIELIASDSQGATSTQSFTISAPDTSAPIFTSSVTADFEENHLGTAYTVVATDKRAVTYSLGSSRDEMLFSIDQNSGEIIFLTSPDFEIPIDVDNQNDYDLEVFASDGDNVASLVVTISVTDVNDNDPVITSNGGGAIANIEVDENSTVITTITAADADALTPYFNFITVAGTDEEFFEVDLTSGVLSWKNGLPDFENPQDHDGDNVYQVVVLAIDGPQATDGTRNTAQTLNIVVRDAALEITSNAVTEVNEDQLYQYEVLTQGENETPVSFSIENGPSWLRFSQAGKVTSKDGTGRDLTKDALGNIYSLSNNQIWKTDVDGNTSVLAGSLGTGYVDGVGTEARFFLPQDITIGPDGNLYVADTRNQRIRKVSPEGVVTTYAGIDHDEWTSDVDGPRLEAKFVWPSGLAFDSHGNLIVADTRQHLIRKIDINGKVTTIAGKIELVYIDRGNGPTPSEVKQGFADGQGEAARFNFPTKVALDSDDNMYITDRFNDRIRKVTAEGLVSTLAGGDTDGREDGIGTDAGFGNPLAIAVDDQNRVFVGDAGIRMISPDGTVVTVAGGRNSGFKDGTGANAELSVIFDLHVDVDGSLLFYDESRGKLRRMVLEPGNKLVGNPDGDVGIHPVSIKASDSEVSVTQSFNLSVLDVTPPLFTSESMVEVSENISTVAYVIQVTDKSNVTYNLGSAKDEIHFSLDDNMLSFVNSPDFESPGDADGNNVYLLDITALDAAGNASTKAIVIRVKNENDNQPELTSETEIIVDQNSDLTYTPNAYDADFNPLTFQASNLPEWLSGNKQNYVVTTIAGNSSEYFKDGPISEAAFADPRDIVMDSRGNMYVADEGGGRIRKISTDGQVSTFAGSGGWGFTDGASDKAEFRRPKGLAIDSNDFIYVADHGNNAIRKIDPQGNVATFFSGGGYSDRNVHGPVGMVLDENGNLWIADQSNRRVKKITADGKITSVAGNDFAKLEDGNGSNASFLKPIDLDIDDEGNVYVLDGLVIRKISPNGDVSTIAGANEEGFQDGPALSAKFLLPKGLLVLENGNILITDSGNNRIRMLDKSGNVTTVAGSSPDSPNDTAYPETTLTSPQGLFLDKQGNVLFTEKRSNSIRKMQLEQLAVSGNASVETGDYQFVITANDGVNQVQEIVTVSVLDRQPPVFTSTTSVNYPENGIGSTYKAMATDFNTVVYSLGANHDEGFFNIDSSSGEVTFKTNPDFETPADADFDNNYRIEVKANDGSNETALMVTVTLTDVNDNAPVITSNGGGMAANIEVIEGSTEVTTITAEDADALTPYFNFIRIGGEDEQLFEVDLTSGEVSWKDGVPDFENPLDHNRDNVYEVIIAAIDGPEALQGTIATTQTLSITVTDINEAPLTLGLSNTTLAENVNSGSEIGMIEVTDPDAEDTHTLSLVVGEGDIDNASFEVKDNALMIIESPDFEIKNGYQVRLKITDSGDLSLEKAFTISITDVNEAPESIALSNESVDENSTTSAAIGDIIVIDKDIGDTHTVEFANGEGDADNAVFNITNGQLVINESPDFETKTSYAIRLRATDSGNLSLEQTFIVTVTDINEAPQAMTLDNLMVDENVNSGSEIGTAEVTDPDAEDTHTLSLVAGVGDADNESFEIVNGTLVINESLDFETKASYEVRLRATDSGNLSIEQTFTITINDLNEAPETINLSDLMVAENVGSGTEIGTLQVDDPDTEDMHVLGLVTGDGDIDNNRFEIVDNQLLLSESPDFEIKDSYTVRVKATDSGDLSMEQIFVISVMDVNESPQAITLSNSIVDENVDSGTEIGTILVTDPDAEDTHVLSLVSGDGDTDNGFFEILDNVLVISESPDFEMKSSYEVRLRVTDSGGLSIEQAFVVTVSDVNEAPLTLSLSNLMIDENVSSGTEIGSAEVTDSDAEDTHVLSLVSGDGDTDNGFFEISDNVLVISESPDFEIKNSYELRLKATDSGNLSIEQAFTITITDVNEAPLTVTLSNLTIDENVSSGSEIGSAGVTDPDAEDTHIMSLVAGEGGADNESFEIVNNTLVISESPDFETKDSYQVRLRATDAGALSLEQTFTITVTDINDTPVSLSISNQTIAENAPAGTVVGNLSTIDQDKDDTHSYSLVSGSGSDDNVTFDVTGDQLVTRDMLDFELKSEYQVRIQTKDEEGAFFEKNFTITVSDVSEPVLRLSESPDIPETGKGESSEFEITVFNDGAADLRIDQITYPDAFSGPAGDITVAPTSSQVITVTFSPSEAVVYQGNIEFVTNAGTQSVQVTGEGAIISSIDDGLFVGNTIIIYPNPADKVLTIDLSELAGNLPLDIAIVNSLGIGQFEIVGYREKLLQVDVSDYKSGLYLVRFTDGKTSVTKKVMIKR